MAFQQGLSGLNANSRALDVIGNNIANASTVGFKASQAQFADIYAGALNGVVNQQQIGLGVNLINIQQLFTQGNLTTTNDPLDIAINGNGFFRLQSALDDQVGYYTRNGQFHMNAEGYIVNANGYYLTGFTANADEKSVNTAKIAPIAVGVSSIPAKQTGWTTTSAGDKGGLLLGVNLDSRDKRAAVNTSADPDWQTLQAFEWGPNFNTNMYNWSTSAAVFDQTGASHTLTNYYVRKDSAGVGSREWDVYTVVDNKYIVGNATGTWPPISPTTPTATATLSFNEDGTLINAPNTRINLDLSRTYFYDGTNYKVADLTQDGTVPTDDQPWFHLTGTSGSGNAYAFKLDLKDTTQFGLGFNQDSAIQDGYTAGSLVKISVAKTGELLAHYSNGEAKLMGQIILDEFRNPNGLQAIGNNLWLETRDSGQPIPGTPGYSTHGLLQSGSVEDSNTDLTRELVNMIIMQRNYQANAQTVRTQDQILQTLVNLR